MGYAFISYSSRNLDMADAFRLLFHKNGIKTWMAPYDIPAGSEYAEVLYDALTGCSCLVLLLTDVSQNSLWVKKEVNIAISNCKTVIPVKLEEVELNSAMKLYLNDQQIVPVRTLNEEDPDVQKVLRSVIAVAGQKEMPAAPVAPAAPAAPAAPVAPAASAIPVAPAASQKTSLVFSNGDRYEGDVVNGVRHGKGKYTWVKGSVYEGDFVNGQRTGKGKFTRPNGETYEGDFVNGKQQGMGKLRHVALTSHDLSYIYEGPFVDDKPMGKGKITYDDSNVYEGDVVKGQRHGTGTFTWNAPTPVVVKIKWVLTPGAEPQWLGGKQQWETGYVYRGTFENDWIQNGKTYDANGVLRVTYVNGIPHYEE